MELSKVFPWVLVVALAFLCWQQQEEIFKLEHEASVLQEVNSIEADIVSQKNVFINKNGKKNKKKSREALQIQDTQRIASSSNHEKMRSKDDIESMIEHRAWERMEELEEEKRQARVEQMTDHMQDLVDDWTERFDWSKDTQNAMMDILTDYVHGRVEVHVLLKNKTLERDDIRPYFQQLAKERNQAIVDLVGEKQLLELETDLDPRLSKK